MTKLSFTRISEIRHSVTLADVDMLPPAKTSARRSNEIIARARALSGAIQETTITKARRRQTGHVSHRRPPKTPNIKRDTDKCYYKPTTN